ncbi:TPA: hypothetical protein ITR69_000058 [Enterococcus faecalis]|nr:hypothetical protein [Enterococcus faecalis]HAP2781578.1 hypothetical protein [Enterococcus faecalis]
MGRYSFFIFNSFLGGYSVYAVGERDNDLFERSQQIVTINGDFNANDKSFIPSDNVGSQSEENQSTEGASQDSGENASESQLSQYEQDLLDSFGGYGDSPENSEYEGRTIRKSGGSFGGGGASGGWGSKLDDHINWAKNDSATHWKRMDAIDNRITNEINRINNEISRLWSDSAVQWNKIVDVENNLNARINNFYTETGNLWASMDKREAAIYGTTAKIEGQIRGIRTELGDIWASMDKREAALYGTTSKINGRVDSVRTELGQIWASMDKREAALYDTTSKINKRVDGVRTELGQIWTSMDKREKALNASVASIRTELGNVWDSMDKREAAVYSTVKKGDDAANKRIDNLWTETGNIWNSINKTNTDVSDLHKRVKRLEEFDFSDVGIIAGLALIKDSVDKFKELFDSYFKVDDLTALMAHEGKFVRMIKSQFISLKDFIEKIFSADYWKSYRDMLSRQMENLYTLMAHYFSMDDKESSLYKIRYSIVSGFGELEKLLKLFQTDILGIRTSLNTISSFFETANKRLEMIYDYLKTMKINVNIGDSVNSAGSTLWDVLKALIEALGNILTAVVNGLADVIDSISSIVGKLLDMLLKLFVPDNLDFMNRKFDGTGKAFKAKFSFVFNWIDVFKGLFSNQRRLEDINISFGGMFAGGVNLPLSKINDFAPLVRAVITGFILLEFLIDMYKWFHTRGEVIE